MQYEKTGFLPFYHGRGGNFGVVTQFEYQLHPFDRNVFSGAIIWPIEQAREVLDFYGGWMDPAQDAEAMAIARAWFKQLEPFTGGYYANIDFDGAESKGGNYGPAHERLSRIKGQYDPGNLFRLNRNIQPAS